MNFLLVQNLCMFSNKIILVIKTIVFLPSYLFKVYKFWSIQKMYLLLHKIFHKMFDVGLSFQMISFNLFIIFFIRFSVFIRYSSLYLIISHLVLLDLEGGEINVGHRASVDSIDGFGEGEC
jgi:hypothetical protein